MGHLTKERVKAKWPVHLMLAAAALLLSLFVALWLLNIGTVAITDFGNRATPLALVMSGLAFAIAGWAILSRTQGNRVGVVCLAIGLVILANSAATEYAIYATKTVPGTVSGGELAAWIGDSTWVIGIGLMATVLPLLFPDGRLPGRHWLWVMVPALVGIFSSVAYFALSPGPLQSISWVENPYGVEGTSEVIEWFSLGFFVLAATIPLGAWSMRRRYRSASGVVRAQLRWFATASGLIALTYIGQFAFSVLTGTMDGGSAIQRWIQTLSIGSFALLGISVGIAVFRYRLYDIDQLITRTVTFVAVITTLGMTFAGLVTLMAIFVSPDDPMAVAIATLGVAALFNPLRSRIHRWIERRFNRSRYNASLVAEQFSLQLQEPVAIETLTDEWLDVIDSTVQPIARSLWLRDARS